MSFAPACEKTKHHIVEEMGLQANRGVDHDFNDFIAPVTLLDLTAEAPHAYGILDLAEAWPFITCLSAKVMVKGKTEHLVKCLAQRFKGLRLARIRNPWGQNAPRTWKGKWGKARPWVLKAKGISTATKVENNSRVENT